MQLLPGEFSWALDCHIYKDFMTYQKSFVSGSSLQLYMLRELACVVSRCFVWKQNTKGNALCVGSWLCMVGFVSKIDTKTLQYIGLNSLGQICCGPGAAEVHEGLSRQNVSDSCVNSDLGSVFQLGSVAVIRWWVWWSCVLPDWDCCKTWDQSSGTFSSLTVCQWPRSTHPGVLFCS